MYVIPRHVRTYISGRVHICTYISVRFPSRRTYVRPWKKGNAPKLAFTYTIPKNILYNKYTNINIPTLKVYLAFYVRTYIYLDVHMYVPCAKGNAPKLAGPRSGQTSIAS